MVLSVIIDKGVFKYIQIECTIAGQQHLLIRGWKDCNYHADILAKFNNTENPHGQWQTECPGGGRIEHNDQEKKIVIFGYS